MPYNISYICCVDILKRSTVKTVISDEAMKNRQLCLTESMIYLDDGCP